MRSGTLQRLDLNSKNETETWRGAEMRGGRNAGLAVLPLPGLRALPLSLSVFIRTLVPSKPFMRLI